MPAKIKLKPLSDQVTIAKDLSSDSTFMKANRPDNLPVLPPDISFQEVKPQMVEMNIKTIKPSMQATVGPIKLEEMTLQTEAGIHFFRKGVISFFASLLLIMATGYFVIFTPRETSLMTEDKKQYPIKKGTLIPVSQEWMRTPASISPMTPDDNTHDRVREQSFGISEGQLTEVFNSNGEDYFPESNIPYEEPVGEAVMNGDETVEQQPVVEGEYDF